MFPGGDNDDGHPRPATHEKSREDEIFLLLSVVGRKGDDGMTKKAIGGKRLQHGA
jgi:hypothetical protein